jgi:hypothetical protein
MTIKYRVARDAVNEPMLEVRELSLSGSFSFFGKVKPKPRTRPWASPDPVKFNQFKPYVRRLQTRTGTLCWNKLLVLNFRMKLYSISVDDC